MRWRSKCAKFNGDLQIVGLHFEIHILKLILIKENWFKNSALTVTILRLTIEASNFSCMLEIDEGFAWEGRSFPYKVNNKTSTLYMVLPSRWLLCCRLCRLLIFSMIHFSQFFLYCRLVLLITWCIPVSKSKVWSIRLTYFENV